MSNASVNMCVKSLQQLLTVKKAAKLQIAIWAFKPGLLYVNI